MCERIIYAEVSRRTKRFENPLPCLERGLTHFELHSLLTKGHGRMNRNRDKRMPVLLPSVLQRHSYCTTEGNCLWSLDWKMYRSLTHATVVYISGVCIERHAKNCRKWLLGSMNSLPADAYWVSTAWNSSPLSQI